MTPTDALIEKMARAIAAIDDGWDDDDCERWKSGTLFQGYLAMARAAYEAGAPSQLRESIAKRVVEDGRWIDEHNIADFLVEIHEVSNGFMVPTVIKDEA